MTETSKVEANQFNGRIIPSNWDFQNTITDISGSHHVWYPASQDDVATAIDLSKNQKTFVRSGKQVARQDEVDGSDGVVINLSELVNVTIDGNKVLVEAAATPEDIVEHLTEHSLALPLSDDPLKSIASNVLNETVSYLTRSLGSLPGYISEIKAVKPDGTPIVLPTSTDRPCTGVSCLALCQESKGIITQVTFEAVPAQNLWMQRFSFPYPGHDEFLHLAQGLFLESDIPENCDLVLDFYSGSHLMPIVRITALGVAEEGKSELKELVAAVVSHLPSVAAIISNLPSDRIPELLAGVDVLEAIAGKGQGAGLDPTIDSERLHSIEAVGQDRAAFIVEYADDIHRGVSYHENGEGKLHRDLQISARLQINRDNALEVTGYAYTPRLIDPTTPTILATAPAARIDTPLHEGVSLTLPLMSPAPSGPIPNFKGDVFEPEDLGYLYRAKVYATTSYPAENLTPLMVAYPRDAEDIAAAIAFARSNNLHIVARSGGHHYSGKSSGGNQTIVLSMDAFDHLTISENIAKVGPAVLLTTLADRFKQEGIAIPHGECPKVAIGGHAQTGGYGHLVRNFGLALDYVEALDIVLAMDEKLRTVTRPAPDSLPSSEEEKLDREIFWGVLGGNAGSFGIVTNYTFKCIKDTDRPNSYGYTATRQYKKIRFEKLMKLVQAMSKDIEDKTLPADIDFMMTVESTGRMPFFPVMLVEAVHGDLPVVNQSVIANEMLKSIDEAVSFEQSNWENLLPLEYGNRSLSDLSDSFVRRWPATTLDGREFEYPYKKRINCTTKALTDNFIQQFVDMVDEVLMQTEGVKLVFQMLMGGGAYQNTKRRQATSIPHRDYVFCFVFDLFYRKGYEQKAIGLQDRMQIVVNEHFSKNQEQRVFWGSFGDTDISKNEIRQMYYDSEQQYAQLQQLKQKVDPNDIFHTTLTVELPG
jgi:FAD/FMN-containing dehydrogenase